MKKSLKKLLFILLTLLSVFFIVACGDKLSKKEVIEKFPIDIIFTFLEFWRTY